MNKPTKSLVVPTIITCTLAWGWFASHAIEECKMDSTNESLNAVNLIERIEENTFTSRVDSFYREFERLKEEERKRLEELERQRLERLEKIRLAKIEEAKKIVEQKRIEELNKQRQQEKAISRGDSTKGNKSYYNVTFYTAGVESTGKSRGDKGYGITASGTTVSEGRTVACPKSIPFGTKIHIEGFGYRVCEDRGGAIVEGHLDVYVESVSKARTLGRQKLLVTILNN